MKPGSDKEPDGTDPRWYVVRSKPHKESFAGANLENQGFQVFLPKLLKTVRHARRTREVRVALFPRYLFVRLDLASGPWRAVMGTYGVAQLVTDGSFPIAAPRGLVEGLIAAADRAGIVDLTRELRPGQAVELLTGPLAGQVGRLVALDGAGRARVLLELLGARREIAVPSSELAPTGGRE
ncbi:transcriptional activator RfaH [Limibaculum sp. FT325]|uniref:transcriptional activator RfaH n=1 Tax=Thermohalobaculum sediminis TaxID=2939436 RepID=UPI0020BFF770|nr:transcriptional activator RfaH [Limibaculum sediminis]MCL5776876.1 transcriptional activator RfaH [Limibaculum sediminis]